MQFKDDTIGDIIESEKQMILHAAERFGVYFINASESNHLLQQFVQSIALDRFIFAMFLQDIRKHLLLALFSAVRLHHVQTEMNLRQVLEAGVCAAYAIANPNRDGFVDVDENGIADTSKELAVERYKWLEKHFKEASKATKGMKNVINKSTAHANIVYAHHGFEFDRIRGKFVASFFDKDDHLVKTDLWEIGNIAIGLMDLFYDVNQKSQGLVQFVDDFKDRLKGLVVENQRLRTEMMNTERYKNAQQLRSRQRA